MNLLQQLENAPKNLVLYTLGLIGSTVDDYTILTLAIFCVLLGFILHAILIPLAVYFGGYFTMRLVNHIAQGVGYHASAVAQAGQQQAQSNMQVAAALAQFHPPEQTDVPSD